MNGAPGTVGRRVLVIGLSGSGKSTFSRALSTQTGLPLIHLDLYYWQPAWVRPTPDQWQKIQRDLFASDDWIADGNYYESLEIQLERAQTVVVLDTPWWICSSRAFRRGLRRPGGVMPEGCKDSVRRRLRDEWGMVGRIWLVRRSDPEQAREMVLRHGPHVVQYVLKTKRAAKELLSKLNDD